MRFLETLKDIGAQRRRVTCGGYFDHFLFLLLAFLLGQSYFYFRLFKAINLIISKVESIDREMAISFFG